MMILNLCNFLGHPILTYVCLLDVTFLYEYKSTIDFLYLAGYRNSQHVSMIIQSKTIFQNSDELRLEKITVIFGSIQTVMTLCRLSFGDQALVKFEPWSDGVLGTTNTHN